MAGNLTAMIASIFSGGVSTDPYFNLTTLLLSTTATNGQQNNTFQDSSTNNFTITRNPATGPNAPTQGTFSPFSQTGWGGAFNTSTTYLTVTDTANLRFGSSNFTIEAWVYRSASGATQTIASKGASTPTGWVFQISSADKLVFTDTSTSITGTTSIAANTWTYVAVVRAGTSANQTTLYVNGTSDGTGTSATNFNQTSNMLVGADRSSTNFANGYISNLRLSNTNRTISSTPTTALTADANTIFLSLNINRFQYTDSTAAFTNISATGTPSVVPFSPFNPTSAWSASTVGGSGYFSGSYLTVPAGSAFNLGTNDFCIEFWLNPIAAATYGGILSFDNNGDYPLNFSYASTNSSNVQANFGTTTAWLYTAFFDTSTATNAWAHYVATRSGSTFRLFKNGVLKATGTNSGVIGDSSGNIYINGNSSSAGTTYISNLRIINGSIPTAYQTSSTTTGTTIFAVPTSPLTTTSQGATASDVKLLLNFTNSGIYDATAKNVLETVGNAQVSTTQSKWSPTSMYFDGTTTPEDLLSTPVLPYSRIGAGDYTLEMWIRPSRVNTLQALLTYGSTAFRIFLNSSNIWFLNSGTSIVQYNSVVTTANQWYYLVLVRKGSSGTNCAIFLNGTRLSTGFTNTTDFNTGTPNIGGEGASNLYQGYMQDFRLTRFARYDPANSTIAVPTAAFPVQ